MSFRTKARRRGLKRIQSATNTLSPTATARREPAEEIEEPKSVPRFSEWLQKTAPPGWSFSARHHQAIARLCERVLLGSLDRVRVHMPPRHGKTQTLLRLLVFLLLTRPGVRILITGYDQSFAKKLSRLARILAVIQGVVLASDKKAADEWHTVDGSMVMARGVGSPPTGEGFDLILIDDPIQSREDAESDKFREKLWDWYTDDLYTRLQPGASIIGVWTRWHEDDLAGRLDDATKSGGDRWEILSLPALADEDDPLGRAVGEALWPEHWPYTPDRLMRTHKLFLAKGHDRSWQALYQQKPTAKTGTFFRVDRIRIEAEAPWGLRWVRAWDVAVTEGAGDWTVGVLMAIAGDGTVWIADVVREQLDTAERDQLIRETAEMDGREVEISLPRDPAAAGKAQIHYWTTQTLAGFTFAERAETGQKTVKAAPFASQVNVGHLAMVRGAWNAALVAEFRQFPDGRHDDIVDAAAGAYNHLIDGSAGIAPMLFR